jgi:hypothetical protein
VEVVAASTVQRQRQPPPMTIGCAATFRARPAAQTMVTTRTGGSWYFGAPRRAPRRALKYHDLLATARGQERGVGLERRSWQRRSGHSASASEPPTAAVPAGAYGLQPTRTGANICLKQLRPDFEVV